MKKILYTALAASLFAFSSCDDILDTSKKSSMEKTEVFSNEALVNDVVIRDCTSHSVKQTLIVDVILPTSESTATVKSGIIRGRKELSLIKKEPW